MREFEVEGNARAPRPRDARLRESTFTLYTLAPPRTYTVVYFVALKLARYTLSKFTVGSRASAASCAPRRPSRAPLVSRPPLSHHFLRGLVEFLATRLGTAVCASTWREGCREEEPPPPGFGADASVAELCSLSCAWYTFQHSGLM